LSSLFYYSSHSYCWPSDNMAVWGINCLFHCGKRLKAT
jgi:hypothetical protein